MERLHTLLSARRFDEAGRLVIEAATPDVKKYLAVMLTCLQDREEMYQDVCLQVMEAMPSLCPGPRFTIRAWVVGIARHRLCDRYRSARRRERLDTAELQRLRGPTWDRPDEQAQKKERRQILRRALPLLPPEDREILHFHSEKMSHGEVGAILGISPDAAKQRLRRALGRLRDLMRALGWDEGGAS